MTLNEAFVIVLQMAEAKWYHHLWGFRKPTERQTKAIRMVSAYCEANIMAEKYYGKNDKMIERYDKK